MIEFRFINLGLEYLAVEKMGVTFVFFSNVCYLLHTHLKGHIFTKALDDSQAFDTIGCNWHACMQYASVQHSLKFITNEAKDKILAVF